MSYHSRRELSSSQVADFLDDKINWYHVHQVRDWPQKEPTPAMRFGTAVHRMIELGGPDKIGVVDVPREVLNKDGHRKGNAWTDFQNSHPEGTQFINPGELNPFRIIWEHLNANAKTRALLGANNKEQVIIWEHGPTGLRCRSMIDCAIPGVIVDWKTCTDISPHKIVGSACDFNYDYRLAFYQRAVEYVTGEIPEVVVVWIQSSPGFQVVPTRMDNSWLAEARDALEIVMEQIAEFDISDHIDRPLIELVKPKYRNLISQREYV